MANEAILRLEVNKPIPYTVADGTGIEKGALLKLTDPRTAIITSGNSDMLAGIAAREKVASDGRTELAVYDSGFFDMVCSGAVTLGQAVISAGGTAAFVNMVKVATITDSGAATLGIAQETGSDAEVIQIKLNIGCNAPQTT